MLARKAHRLLRILERTQGFIDHGRVTRDAVLDHERGDAVIDEEAGLLGAFEIEGETGVGTTGKYDDTGARGLCPGGQVDLDDGSGDFLYPAAVRRRFLVGAGLRVRNRGVTIERNALHLRREVRGVWRRRGSRFPCCAGDGHTGEQSQGNAALNLLIIGTCSARRVTAPTTAGWPNSGCSATATGSARSTDPRCSCQR